MKANFHDKYQTNQLNYSSSGNKLFSKLMGNSYGAYQNNVNRAYNDINNAYDQR